jgi:hypothetical protein
MDLVWHFVFSGVMAFPEWKVGIEEYKGRGLTTYSGSAAPLFPQKGLKKG